MPLIARSTSVCVCVLPSACVTEHDAARPASEHAAMLLTVQAMSHCVVCNRDCVLMCVCVCVCVCLCVCVM